MLVCCGRALSGSKKDVRNLLYAFVSSGSQDVTTSQALRLGSGQYQARSKGHVGGLCFGRRMHVTVALGVLSATLADCRI